MVCRLGSVGVGSWLAGLFSFCRKGGSRSPQCLPLSVDQSMPHWLKPTRLSFWPASRLLGSSGLNVIVSSAWRRKLQSWFTRLLPLPSRPEHPIEPGAAPRSAAGRSCPVPAASAASSRSSPAETPRACCAAATVPADRNGSGRVSVTTWPSLMTCICKTAALTLPLATFLAMLSPSSASAGALPAAMLTASTPKKLHVRETRMLPTLSWPETDVRVGCPASAFRSDGSRGGQRKCPLAARCPRTRFPSGASCKVFRSFIDVYCASR